MFRLGSLLLGGLALGGFLAYPYLDGIGASSSAGLPEARDIVAELDSTSGSVEVRERSSVAWRKGTAGMRLSAGDLIQTGSSGTALIRFAAGAVLTVPADTLFSVRDVADATRSGAGKIAAEAVRINTEAPPLPAPAEPHPADPAQCEPGLEVVGRIDPGNNLTINGEPVQVGPDGSFTHFTRAFRAPGLVQLVLKTTDLAGRSKGFTGNARVQ